MKIVRLWLLAVLMASTVGCSIELPEEIAPEVRKICVQDGKEVLCPGSQEPETTCITAAGTSTCDLTVTRMNTPPQNVAIGVPNQFFGGYTVNAPEEGASVGTSIFHIRASVRSPLSTNVVLYNEAGTIVAGPVDATHGEGDSETVTFTDMITYAKGRHTYVLKGTVSSETSNGTTFTTSFNPSKDWTSVKGQTTGDSLDVPDTLLILGTVTAKGLALNIFESEKPPARTVIAGSVGVHMGYVYLDATASSEDMLVSLIPYTLDASSGFYASLSACQLFDGATPLNTGGQIVNPNTPTGMFTFDFTLTVPKGTTKVLERKCNISSGATGTFTWSITGEQLAGTHVLSAISKTRVHPTWQTSVGSTMTIGVGSLSVSISPRSPLFTLVAAGSQDVNAGIHRYCASNEGRFLYQVGLRLASGSPESIVNVSLWDDGGEGKSVQWGSSMFVGDRLTTTMFLKASGPWIEEGTCKNLTIRATLSNTGLEYSGIEGDFIRIEVVPRGTSSVGDTSGIAEAVVGYTETAGFRMLKSFPTVVLEPLNATSLADGNFMQFKVMADWHGNIALRHMQFSITCTGLEIKDVALFAYSDSSYTTPIYGVVEGNLTGTIGLAPLTSSVGLYLGLPSVTVPAGGAYYFRLKGTVLPTEATYACVTKLFGDPRFSSSTGAENFALGTVNDLLGTTMSGFIWNAVGNTDDNDRRWTNGVGVPGLPADGLSQFRSN